MSLLSLLAKVRVVVFVGGKAAKAMPLFQKSRMVLIKSDHPSPLVRARWPERWGRIPEDWRAVGRYK